ncbi:hypothetical protein M427DRAFT_26820 [Gonapodya prolifera JEL478]|uniref:SET domain-containing protein n=1 Tax=Gonapodya prolifera (strain JEL478) TaxID=1344416 RepID=A0A139AZM3_GONPJ|nr:hypothetical protein M427DRAFT_26820 [Gonapodya prolifera JEL478]|eukprot:KXS22192.1 hypothetical protein M427DRAFT_26820 [Gonapodya prolifera JEL478]
MESLNSYLRGLKGSENVRIVDHPDEDRTDRVMVAARELVPGDVILTERPLLHTSQSFARSFRPDPSIPTLPPDYQRVEYEFIRRYTARSREQHENDQSRDEALFNVAMKLLSTDGVDGETATEAFPRRRKDYERGLKVFLKLVKKEYKRNAAATAATVDEEEPMDVADAKGQTKSALKREGDDAVQISSPAPKRRKISGPESFDTANLPPISDLLRLVSILETNCHSRAHSFKNEPVAATSPDDADPPRDESLGLYLAGSFMDHSCAPNATVVLRGVSQSPEDAGVLTLLCLRTIPPNTPITINYTDSEFIPTKERRQTLFRRGFLCACEACCGRDIARAGICSGSCGGIGIVSPTPIEDGSESEDQADDSAVEDPSGETLMFSCDICARRYSSQQANKFIEAEDAIGVG